MKFGRLNLTSAMPSPHRHPGLDPGSSFLLSHAKAQRRKGAKAQRHEDLVQDLGVFAALRGVDSRLRGNDGKMSNATK